MFPNRIQSSAISLEDVPNEEPHYCSQVAMRFLNAFNWRMNQQQIASNPNGQINSSSKGNNLQTHQVILNNTQSTQQHSAQFNNRNSQMMANTTGQNDVPLMERTAFTFGLFISRPIGQRDQSFLPFILKYQPENNIEYWKNIMFHLYSFYWLQLTISKLSNLDIKYHLAIVFLLKVEITLEEELIEELKNNFPNLTCLLFKQLLRDLNYQKRINKDQLNQLIDFNTEEIATGDLSFAFNKFSQYVNNECHKFDQLKMPLRVCLNHIYNLTVNTLNQTQNFEVFVHLQLLLACSMVINKIFTSTREQSFQVFKDHFKIQQFESPQEIEDCINESPLIIRNKQIKYIQDLYFGR
ncbi:hypothetical protein pb186bvf_007538 [Paramecium bursaria]